VSRPAEPEAPDPAWCTLLGPLPPKAKPERKPIGSPEVLASAAGSPIARWQNLSLEIPSSPSGYRYLLIVLDETRRPIAASDHVVIHWPDPADPGAPRQMRQESIGGRLEPDGRFLGTCWLVTGPEPRGDEEPAWESTPRPPTGEEAAALKELVAEIVARAR